MSFFQRAQPYLLSGFVAVSATLSSSCPPDPLYGTHHDDGDDGPDACPVRDLPPLHEGPDGPLAALGDLASRGIGPATFHVEDAWRFRTLTGVCSPSQIDRFEGLQVALVERVRAMEPARIASTLEELYDRSYAYDENSLTMAVGVSPRHVSAKRRLDLWIAAVDRCAFEDASFLKRVWEEPRIHGLMALNSPHLSPEARADMERLLRAQALPEAEREGVYRDVSARGYRTHLEWLDSYSGERLMFDEPYWRSDLDYFQAGQAFFGKDGFARMGLKAFPKEEVEGLLRDRGFLDVYQGVLKATDDSLISTYVDVGVAILPTLKPATARSLAKAGFLIAAAMHERGLDASGKIDEKFRRELRIGGWDDGDAERVVELQQGVAKNTASRLDDYRGRHAFLAEYRRLYEDLVTQPLDKAFSPQNQSRFSVWNGILFNRSLSGVPVSLEELDAIRSSVLKERIADVRFASPGSTVPGTVGQYWAMPSELGLCGSVVGGPMVHLSGLRAQGVGLNDLVCDNVELIAFLDPKNVPIHAIASAYGVFGIVVARNDGTAGGRDWTPGQLADTMSHEASHIEWFRDYFEDESEKLLMLGPNERRAYAVGRSFLLEYLESGLATAEEDRLWQQLTFNEDAVTLSNERLGIPRHDLDPWYWDDHWNAPDLQRFVFQPGTLASNRHFTRRTEAVFGPLDPASVRREGARYLETKIHALLRNPAERREALDALRFLGSTANATDVSRFFLMRSHPLTRVMSALSGPQVILDYDQSAWLEIQDGFGRSALEGERWERLLRSAEARRPR